MDNGESDERRAFVQEARLQLDKGTDANSVGAAVTVALCGHWEHEGACRWPHNNDIHVDSSGARFRTLFISSPRDEEEVRERITLALTRDAGISAIDLYSRPVTVREQALADRLLGSISDSSG